MRPPARLSVTARIASLSIALALVCNLALVGLVWQQTRSDAIDRLRRDTQEQADTLVEVHRAGGLNALEEAMRDARRTGDRSLILAVVDGAGRLVDGIGPRALRAQELRPTSFAIGYADDDESPWSKREAGFAIRRIGPDWLIAGRLLDDWQETQRALERALALSVALSLVLGVAAGLVVTRYVGRRLDRIATVIGRAGEGDLSRRVALAAGGRDAFDRLAGELNAMLARLERVMGELRVVTDGLAHDLRSPIARLRTKTETALLTADPTQREAALAGLMTEADLVLRMLSTMVEISRSESATRDRFIRVDPAALIEELGELYAPVVEDAGPRFTVLIEARPEPIAIHRELLSQAVTNLLDNAIHHAAAGGEVTLRLASAPGEARIEVADRGPGIAPADRSRALRRFGRLDAARSTPGAGLGLSLIEAVVRLHGGRFELADNAPGLVARIVLPTGSS